MDRSQSCALKQHNANKPVVVHVSLADVSETRDVLVPKEACECTNTKVQPADFLTANNEF